MSDTTSTTPEQDEATVGELFADATRDLSEIIRNEIALAKAELTVSMKFGGAGSGLIALAGFIVLLSVIFLLVAVAYFLHMTGLDLAWCFLIVFFGMVLIAAGLGFAGYTMVRRVRGPERAIAQAKETKEMLTNR
jgi:hypothetical protein